MDQDWFLLAVSIYADTSFLVAAYSPESNSMRALTWLQKARAPLPFTPLHRHELRTAIRLRVFRHEITAAQCKLAFQELESDITSDVLVHTPAPWTDAFREAEKLGALQTERLGVRSFDLLHVGLACVLNASEFLTFDSRQAALVKAAGLRLVPV
ncbi:MAG: twitching motility protein PilT [Pedosphaera sp.]|nr:twitching motility protein PilT [Pedosphaera sp.]